MDTTESLTILDNAYTQYNVKEIWALFSGGHDSLVNTHVTSQHSRFKGVLHIDTGTGIKETQDYVIETCKKFNWELKIYRATEYVNAKGELTPQVYSEMVLEHGFPGAFLHRKMYNRLKGMPISQFIRDWQKNNKKEIIGLSTGTRKQESVRRAINMNRQNHWVKDGRKIWINPIAEWSKDDCEEYIKFNNLPRNAVKDKLCMSGECLCGAFAQPNELKQIEFFYPEKGQELRELEKQVKANGFSWGWDEQPPKWWSDKVRMRKCEEQGQLNLFAPLCTSCQYVYENSVNP